MSDELSAYAGLARLLDAVLDDGQPAEPTTDTFLEDALRRFGRVRDELNDSVPVDSTPKLATDNIGVSVTSGRALSHDGPATQMDTDRLMHTLGIGIGTSAPHWSIYTLRHHSHLDNNDLERQYFEVIEAVRSNGHTTPDFNNGRGLLKMIAGQAHSSNIFTAEAAAYVELAKNRRHAGHFKEAEGHARTALKISNQHEFRRTTILAHIELGMLSCDEIHLDPATDLIEPTDVDLRARLAYAYARCARVRGDLVKAIELIAQSEVRYEAAGDAFGLARAKARLGSYLRLLGDFQAAIHHLEEALALAQRGGFRRVEAYVLLDLADILRTTGHDSAAGALLQAARKIFSVMGHIGGKARALVGLSLLEASQGNNAAGVAYADEACALYQNVDRVMGRGVSTSTALALRCLGGCLADLDVAEDDVSRTARLERANACLDRAITAYRTLGHRDGEALALVVKAKLLAHSATPEAALPLAVQALDILAEMPGRFWQGTDTTRKEGFHSWCYKETMSIAIGCDNYHVAQRALLAGEHDKTLRELRTLLVRQGGELGETVHKLALVELMMHSPAHEPDLVLNTPHTSRPMNHEKRDKLLQRIEELNSDVASRIRND